MEGRRLEGRIVESISTQLGRLSPLAHHCPPSLAQIAVHVPARRADTLRGMSNYDPMDLRAQERAKADKELRDKLALETEGADLKWLVSTKRGRRIVWRLLEQSGVFRLSFSTNAMQMAFNEGSRNSGNRLLALITEVVPEVVPVMMKEAKAVDENVQ